MTQARAIKIAVTALGGQGGGVLANWIVAVGERAGYIAQTTSVPGVAQRTGATVYYAELFPESAAREKGKAPVLALMPMPGDVDVVVAAELMEAGRAIARGFVTSQTTLIAASHREYAVVEKIGMSDGRRDSSSVIEAAKKSAGRFILADMQGAAASSGAMISAAMFGALAGSGALPIERKHFEETIRKTGRAVESNLAAFEKGFEAARAAAATEPAIERRRKTDIAPQPAPAVRPLVDRVQNEFPAECRSMLLEGLKKVVDYQDPRYGALYLDRVADALATDKAAKGEGHDWKLTNAIAKHLALWMAYEDAIRVADLKTRGTRFERIRKDVRAADGQIIHLAEFFHPRVEEFCDLLPAGLATPILSSKGASRFVGGFLGGGRRIPTTKLRGFLMLSFLSSLRVMRRASYRFKLEEGRIRAWLETVKREAAGNYDLACEIAMLQRLIKGYGDTHERGLGNFTRIMAALDEVKAQGDPAGSLAALKKAALADEEGVALGAALRRLKQAA
ncbi:MAG: indolepyruvate oxidoreductase subunit beta family protein [Parvularculaceae bacterium]